MRGLSLERTGETAKSRRYELLGLVRGACEALLSTQPAVIEAVTVSRAIEDRDGAGFLRDMGARVAQEYGLCAETRLTETGFAIRLSRPAAHQRCGSFSQWEATPPGAHV